MLLLLSAAVAYLLGCLSTGYYLVRLRTGADVRAQGSGATGARNVGRVLGRSGFAVVFTGDLAKGSAAVALAYALGVGQDGAALAALAVTAGHVFPAQLGFRGGKGACTSFGALVVLDPQLALGGALVCALLLLALRHAVHGFLLAFTLLPLLAVALGRPAAAVAGVLGLWAIVMVGFRRDLAAAALRPARAEPAAGPRR